MFVHGPQYCGQKDQELGIILWGVEPGLRRFWPSEEQRDQLLCLPLPFTPAKGFFMQQADKTVPGSQMPHDIHGQHIVIAGIIGIALHKPGRSRTAPAPPHCGVSWRNAQGHKLIFHILHETHYPGGNGAKIVVFHFLPLGEGAPISVRPARRISGLKAARLLSTKKYSCSGPTIARTYL